MADLVPAPDPDLSTLTLDELGERIRVSSVSAERYKTVAVRAVRRGIDHAIVAGEAGMEARNRVFARDPDKGVSHDQIKAWHEWLNTVAGVSYMTMENYMRLAKYKHVLADTTEPIFTVSAGLRYISEYPPPEHPLHVTPEQEQEIRRLHAAGHTGKEIAGMLGVHGTAVRRITDPNRHSSAVRGAHKRVRKWRLAGQALNEKEMREERDRLAATSSGEAAAAYGYLRQALARLDRALDATDSPDERAALRNSIAAAHKAEDALIEAMKLAKTDHTT